MKLVYARERTLLTAKGKTVQTHPPTIYLDGSPFRFRFYWHGEHIIRWCLSVGTLDLTRWHRDVITRRAERKGTRLPRTGLSGTTGRSPSRSSRRRHDPGGELPDQAGR